MRLMALDLQRFGRLTVLSLHPIRTGSGQSRWLCRCDCGREVVVQGGKLRSGHTSSCGCLKIQQVATLNRTHGRSDTPEYYVWATMRQRVLNPNDRAYRYYGARGITICPEWDSFERFLADMGPRPSPLHSIDRINNDAGYSPQNCRWVVQAEQRHNRRDSLWLEHEGRRLPLAEWARETGIKYKTLLWRLQHGRTATQILSPIGRSL